MDGVSARFWSCNWVEKELQKMRAETWSWVKLLTSQGLKFPICWHVFSAFQHHHWCNAEPRNSSFLLFMLWLVSLYLCVNILSYGWPLLIIFQEAPLYVLAYDILFLWQDYVKRQTRFVSRKPAKVIISTIEAVAESMSLKVHTRNYKVWLVLHFAESHLTYWTMFLMSCAFYP